MSKQDYLSKYKPPRVHIQYKLETEGAIVVKELPFVMGIVADLIGTNKNYKPYQERKFIYVTKENFSDIMKAMGVELDVGFTFKDKNLSHTFKFASMEDFLPNNFLKQNELLNDCFQTRIKLMDLRVKISNNSYLMDVAKEIMTGGNITTILENLEHNFHFVSNQQKITTNDLFLNFSKLPIKCSTPIETVQANILNIDNELSKSINEILHNREFQKLESTWRGVHHLIKNLPISKSLAVRIFHASLDELRSDLLNSMEIDETVMFYNVYEKEFGTYGGEPFTCLIMDYRIGREMNDMMLLNKSAELASCAHVPTIFGIHPSMFDLDSFENLHLPKSISPIFQTKDMIPWNSFRDLDDSRYVAFVAPRFLTRSPYDIRNNPLTDLSINEKIEGHEDFCWTNSVYAYGQRIAEAFFNFGWFSAIIGAETGGLVQNLPVYCFINEDGEEVMQCPTETLITDRREVEIKEEGIISLCFKRNSDQAVFFSGQSAQRAKKYNKAIANSNAALSSRFQYILNVSRFAHYIKCIMRDKIGSFFTKEDMQSYLNSWISGYVLLNGEATDELKAKYPLSSASVEVVQNPNNPGELQAKIWLQPHFQMEQLMVSLLLVARIPGEE